LPVYFTAPHAVKIRAFLPVHGRFMRLTLDYRLKGKRYIDRRGSHPRAATGATTSSAIRRRLQTPLRAPV